VVYSQETEKENQTEKRTKPSDEDISQLQRQKRQIRANRLKEIKFNVGANYEAIKGIGELSKYRGIKRLERIKKVIENIKHLQKKNNLCSFRREFLNTLLSQYTQLNERTKRRIIKELLSHAVKSERVVRVRYLEKDCRNKGVTELIRREHNTLKTFYSFN